MSMLCLYTRFHVSNSIVIDCKPVAKAIFVWSESCYFTLHKSCVFFVKIYYHTSFQDPKLCGVNAVPISNVRVSAILVILISLLCLKLRSMKLGAVSSDMTTRPQLNVLTFII